MLWLQNNHSFLLVRHLEFGCGGGGIQEGNPQSDLLFAMAQLFFSLTRVPQEQPGSVRAITALCFSCSAGPPPVCCGWQHRRGEDWQQDGQGQAVPLGRGAGYVSGSGIGLLPLLSPGQDRPGFLSPLTRHTEGVVGLILGSREGRSSSSSSQVGKRCRLDPSMPSVEGRFRWERAPSLGVAVLTSAL